jgi:hypothetical protein
VLIGINLAECGRDNDPEAQELEAYSVVVRVRHQQTYDTKGIQFFALVTPTGEALLSVDGDHDLSKELLRLTDKKVRLTVEDAELQRVER